MRKRVDQLGVAQPEIQRSGADEIDVALPDVTNAERAEQEVGKTAQLFFYDWEPNVIGPDGKPAPTEATVTGGRAGRRGAVRPDRSTRRSCAPRNARPNCARPTRPGAKAARRSRSAAASTAAGTCSNPSTKRCCAAPRKPKRTCSPRRKVQAKGPKASRRVRVNPGTVLVQARPIESDKPARSPTRAPNSWYVLNDNPVLTRRRHQEPARRASTKAPAAPARRTSRSASPGTARASFRTSPRRSPTAARKRSCPGVGKEAAQQHFAVVLDEQLITTPSIDYTKYPEGIDAATGSQISGGFTITSAQELANELQSGALPIKLEPISNSQVSATLGKTALNQGLIAGLVGFAHRLPVPAALLPRARRDRGRRPGDLRHLLLRADQADPDHADAAGHRRADPHDRRRGRREHRDLRARQGGDPRRKIGDLRHRHRLQARLRGDRRRQRGDVHDRVHPVRAGDRRSQGLRLHAGHRHARLAVHRRARDAGGARRDGPLANSSRTRRRSAPSGAAKAGRSTSWARRSGSSRCRA